MILIGMKPHAFDRGGRIVAGALWAVCAGLLAGPMVADAQHPSGTLRGTCVREGAKLVGARPVYADRNFRLPKKIHNAAPTYPNPPAGTVGTGGAWVGEALIDTQGRIARVWTIRPVKFTPPFPKFNTAIADSIKEWRFEPPTVNGVATPVCLPVTVNINWKVVG
jgi:hypothetical protein